MGYSCKIYFRKNYMKKDGTCGIYLQVIINRRKKPLPLDLSWPAKYCEDSQELCKPKFKSDNESDDMNLLCDRLPVKLKKNGRMDDCVTWQIY